MGTTGPRLPLTLDAPGGPQFGIWSSAFERRSYAESNNCTHGNPKKGLANMQKRKQFFFKIKSNDQHPPKDTSSHLRPFSDTTCSLEHDPTSCSLMEMSNPTRKLTGKHIGMARKPENKESDMNPKQEHFKGNPVAERYVSREPGRSTLRLAILKKRNNDMGPPLRFGQGNPNLGSTTFLKSDSPTAARSDTCTCLKMVKWGNPKSGLPLVSLHKQPKGVPPKKTDQLQKQDPKT